MILFLIKNLCENISVQVWVTPKTKSSGSDFASISASQALQTLSFLSPCSKATTTTEPTRPSKPAFQNPLQLSFHSRSISQSHYYLIPS